MRFGILGPTQVILADGRAVTIGGARLRALLALLLLEPGRMVPAERLIDGLYGTNPPAGAQNALQSQISRLRQTLAGEAGRQPPLEFHQAGYRLAVDPEDVDARRFARLAADGRHALAAGDPSHAAALLRDALDLWRGPALADIGDVPFRRAQAARLDELRLGAVEDRIDAELELGGHGPPIAELRELVTAYPLRERLRGQLMRALYASGRQAEALAAFEDARRVLAEELGADPSAELAAVHVAILRANDSPDAVPAPRQGLPGQLTTFLGREEELGRVGKLLAEARLVTLSGPGGAGKTRLAVEAAGRQPGDVCFVELASLDDGTHVPQAVRNALGLRDAGLRASVDQHSEPTDRLATALAGRALLLVLDNCEHVVADAARLAARLLAACPTLRILATSREPLRVTGEALCPVPGLALPPEKITPEAAREFPAVRLFAARAEDVAPGFTLDAANVDAVLRICRTLDGLPLAIELAAARVRALPVTEVAARLDDRFRLLSRGSRGAQPRHQTLRAAVEWSWDLLDEPEQALARRLTVFAGGASLPAVERVCGRPGTDVVDVLTSLADKSLIEVGDGRYRMLETVRAFCAERLDESGEASQLRIAHAAYFLDLAQTADPRLRRAEQLTWLRRLDAERENLHAALRRSMAAPDPVTALRLVAALSFYWWLRGMRGEAAVLAGELLRTLGPEAPPELDEEYTLCALNASLGMSGEPDPRLAALLSESIGRTLDRPPRLPFLLFLVGMASGPPGDADTSTALIARNQRLLGSDPWVQALGQLGLGMTWLLGERYDQARHDLTGALGAFRTLGERWGAMSTQAGLAEVEIRCGNHADAIAQTDEALRLAGELDSIVDMADLLRTRGAARAGAGDLCGAYDDYDRTVELARRAGAPELLAAAHVGLGEIAQLRGDLGEARRLSELALAECPSGWFTADATRFGILVTLGRVTGAQGETRQARTWYRRALAAKGGHYDLPTLADAVEGLLDLALRDQGAGPATLVLGAVTALLSTTGAVSAASLARITAGARTRLGEALDEPTLARGAALSPAQALAVISGEPADA